MAGITVSFIIYSQWAPLTLMLTAAPGNGLLNSDTCCWLICLLSKGVGWPEAILCHDTLLNGSRALGVCWLDGRHALEKHCGMENRQWVSASRCTSESIGSLSLPDLNVSGRKCEDGERSSACAVVFQSWWSHENTYLEKWNWRWFLYKMDIWRIQWMLSAAGCSVFLV